MMKRIFITLSILLLMTANSFAVSNILLSTVSVTSGCSLPVTISGLDTITRNTTNQSFTCSCGLVSWSISGTGATIDGSGQVTTDGTACGGLVTTITYSEGSVTKSMRVTDAGQWVTISMPCMCWTGCGTTCWTYVETGNMRYDEQWACYYDTFTCVEAFPQCGGEPSYTTPCISCPTGSHSCMVGQTIKEWQCP